MDALYEVCRKLSIGLSSLCVLLTVESVYVAQRAWLGMWPSAEERNAVVCDQALCPLNGCVGSTRHISLACDAGADAIMWRQTLTHACDAGADAMMWRQTLMQACDAGADTGM